MDKERLKNGYKLASRKPCVCRVFLFRLRTRDAARPRSTLRGLFATKFAVSPGGFAILFVDFAVA